jgi:hypothetical protein
LRNLFIEQKEEEACNARKREQGRGAVRSISGGHVYNERQEIISRQQLKSFYFHSFELIYVKLIETGNQNDIIPQLMIFFKCNKLLIILSYFR